MGTSGSTKGSRSDNPLNPTWLNEPPEPLPGGEQDAPQEGDGKDDQQTDTDKEKRGPIPPPPELERFADGRGNFTKFASSSGSDDKALRRAVRDYVRSGTGGAANAVQRMGSSRRAASNALGVFRGIQRDGLAETLRRLNLNNLVGRSAEDVFIGLTDAICRDGGSIDEATARDAWLETVAELDQLGITDLDALTDDQIRQIFLSFIAHSIETRLYQEIGVNGFKAAAGITDIEAFDKQFKSYIERSVRDAFTQDLSGISAMTDEDIRRTVDQTYREAWELFELLGDREQ
jgi:hypothetical protein